MPATWPVKPDHSGDVATIQGAVDTATELDPILLDNGTFTAPLDRAVDFGARNLFVMPKKGANPFIDCAGTWRGFLHAGGQSSRSILTAQAFRGVVKLAENDGVIRYTNGSSPTIVTCVFIDCCAVNGGAISAESGAGPHVMAQDRTS